MASSSMGILFAFITTLSWAICIFPFTEAARRMGPNPVNHYRLLLALVLLSIMVFIPLAGTPPLPSQLLHGPPTEAWMWLALSGVVGLALGDYFGFTMYAILGSRLGSVFITFAPGAALVFAWLLLGETINAVGVGGIAITVGGVAWLTMHKQNREPHTDLGYGSKARGIGFGVLAALCQGVGLVLAKKGMAASEEVFVLTPVHTTWMRMVAGTIVVFGITILSGRFATVSRPVFRNQQNGIKYMVWGTLFGPVFGVSLSLLTITYLTVPVAQTIFALVPVFVLPGAYFYYRERITRKSIVGALIAIVGVIILIWRNDFASALAGLWK